MDSPTNSLPADARRAVITRVGDDTWRALAGDREIGRGEATRRGGRTFLAVDAWHVAVFDGLAAAMLAALPRPLHTLADGGDHDTIAAWRRAGLTVARREWLYALPVGARPDAPPPDGVVVLPVGAADPARLQAACDEIRAEIDAETGWAAMPVDMPPAPPGAPADPGRYAVAAGPDRYEAIARVTVRRRHARIGLVAVRADRRRRGIGRALLLADLRRAGIEAASADVDEANPAATALAESVGGRRVSSLVELVAR